MPVSPSPVRTSQYGIGPSHFWNCQPNTFS